MKTECSFSDNIPTIGTRPRRPNWLDRLARRFVLDRLKGLQNGRVTIVDADGEWTLGHPADDLPTPTVHVRDARFYRDLLLGGSLGAAESYIDGRWTTDDLVSLVRLFARAGRLADSIDQGFAGWRRGRWQREHRRRQNSPDGSRRNISDHYDLGNDFFATFLDESLCYSCGIFATASTALQDASVAKMDRICQRLALKPTDHLLEIGTGWGGFALHAAQRHGCRVTTTTLSRKQFELARQRVREANLEHRVTVLNDDYRALTGQFDKLASIEMIEAVGHEFFDTFFACCNRLLKPTGLMALQTITISDQAYDQAIRSVDFIQRHIFPGGCLPCISALAQSTARATDLRWIHFEDFADHYARTLWHWRHRFLDGIDRLRRLGCDDRFLRKWHYYFCYCEGGFLERAIGLAQIVLAKPMYRGDAVECGTSDDSNRNRDQAIHFLHLTQPAPSARTMLDFMNNVSDYLPIDADSALLSNEAKPC